MFGANSHKAFFCLTASMLTIGVPTFADTNLYTSYVFNGPNTIDMMTCGTTDTGQGCFGGGSLLRLQGVCSLLVGPSTTQGNVSRQPVYLLETGTAAAPNVTLKIYSKVVRAQPTTVGPNPSTKVTTTASLMKSVNISSLKGGVGVTCNMAANANSLFLSTSATARAVMVDKSKFTSHAFGSGRVHEINSDEEGYVSVIFEGGSPSQYIFGPDSKSISIGGIANPPVIPNQINGVPLN